LRLGLVQRRHLFQHATLLRHEFGDVADHPLLAAGGLQQFSIKRFVPMPVQAVLAERFVERTAVELLGLRQGSIDIEDQRFKRHCIASSER